MATIRPIQFTLSLDRQGASASLRSICEVLAATGGVSQALTERFGDLFGSEREGGSVDLIAQAADLICIEPVDRAAPRTGKVVLHPSKRYLELVSAIAGERNVSANAYFHGWPILSIDAGSSIVAGTGGAASAPGEGAA